MNHRIACYTLFDITQTGVVNRARPNNIMDNAQWYNQRNTQCNFDTILQIISLRSQPDVEKYPIKMIKKFDDTSVFGNKYHDYKVHEFWYFEFSVQHSSVFENKHDELGYLYEDSFKVPMIITDNISLDISNYIEIDKSSRNIYFEKL